MFKFSETSSSFPAHFLDELESDIVLKEGGVARVEERGEGNTPAHNRQPAATEAGSIYTDSQLVLPIVNVTYYINF